MYAWEDPVQAKIQACREQEVEKLTTFHMNKMVMTAAMYIGPVLVSFSLFLCYALLGNTFTVPQVYTVYALFNVIRLPFSLTPQVCKGIEIFACIHALLLLEL